MDKKQLAIDFKEVFTTPAGERVLGQMKVNCQYDVVVPPKKGTDGHIDIYHLVRREAQREIITYIEMQLRSKGITNE